MVIRKKLYLYVSRQDDPESTLVMKRRLTNEIPFWSLLHVVVEYEQGNQKSFNQSVYSKLCESIHIEQGTLNVVDVSKQGDIWATLFCSNTSFATNDIHCIESAVFPFEHLHLLNGNNNLVEFLTLYPTYQKLKERLEQLGKTKAN